MWSTPTYIDYQNGWIEKPKMNGSISLFSFRPFSTGSAFRFEIVWVDINTNLAKTTYSLAFLRSESICIVFLQYLWSNNWYGEGEGDRDVCVEEADLKIFSKWSLLRLLSFFLAPVLIN